MHTGGFIQASLQENSFPLFSSTVINFGVINVTSPLVQQFIILTTEF